MDVAAVVALQLLAGVAVLALIGVGLAIVFGMMRVINLAHGEFLMLGGYAAIGGHALGLNLWVAMLAVAPLTVGAAGWLVERLLIRRLYGRMTDTLLATWGLGLLMAGGVSMAFGNTVRGVSAPLGSFAIGDFGVAVYDLVLIGAAAVVLLGVHGALRWTAAGLRARAAAQNPDMAAALGVDPARVHAGAFTAGAALTGLAGALLAPMTGVVPTIGVAYVAKAFVTVIAGGASAVAGLLSSSALLGGIGTAVSYVATPVLGEVALLAAALVVVRLWPRGIAGRFFGAPS